MTGIEVLSAFASTLIWFFASLVTTRNFRIAAYIGASIGAWGLLLTTIAGDISVLGIIGLLGVIGINWYFLKSPKRVVINFVLAFIFAIVLGAVLVGVIIVGLGGLV